MVPPRRQTRGLTDIVSVDSPMGLPNGSGKLTIGGQEAVDAQVRDNSSTMMVLVKPEFPTSTPHINVQSDGKGR